MPKTLLGRSPQRLTGARYDDAVSKGCSGVRLLGNLGTPLRLISATTTTDSSTILTAPFFAVTRSGGSAGRGHRTNHGTPAKRTGRREGYRPRSVDALRPYLQRIEEHILELAGVSASPAKAPNSRIVADAAR